MSIGLQRPPAIRAVNAVGAVARRLGVAPTLAVDDLLSRARRSTGLDDFGWDTFGSHAREGLDVLVTSLTQEAELNFIGTMAAQRRVLTLLETRLRLLDHRRRHPGVSEQQIERPIFVIGLPRTGTTVLYGLLASDPALRSPVSWEVARPFPPPTETTRWDDPRIAMTDKEFDQFRKVAPGIDRIHPLGAMLPQECLAMHAPEFASYEFPTTFPVPSYWDWLRAQDMTPAYRFQHAFLQHLQSGYGGEHWILKTPGHLMWLDTLLAVFPDALVVQTHRDPTKVLASVSSLMYALRSSVSDNVDPHQVGREQLEHWTWGLQRTLAARESLPDDRIVDVRFAETLNDPVGTVQRIREHFGLPSGPAVEQGVRDYLAANPRTKHGVHSYTLEDFGLDEATTRAAFGAYNERFGIDEATA